MRPLLAALLLSLTASAQAPADSTSTDSTGVSSDSLVARRPSPVVALLTGTLDRARDVAEARRAAAEKTMKAAEDARALAAQARAAQPVVARLGTSGAVAVLPPGWDGPSTSNELRAPAYSSYELTNTRDDHALVGTSLRIERITGLQEPFRRRWLNGQSGQGYHGLEGVAAAELPLPGVGIELAGRGRGGAVAFVQTTTAYWAVHVSAPETTWRARRSDVVGLMRGLDLP